MTFMPDIDDEMAAVVHLIQDDRNEGLNKLRELAESGDRSAICHLGMYLSEDASTTESAMKWLLMADEFGSADAAWNIAMIAHERGDCVELKRWIDRAAELGENDAKEIQASGYDVDSFLATIK